jgi:hypothetical protein
MDWSSSQGSLRLVLWGNLENACRLKPDGCAKELTIVSEIKQYPRPIQCTRNTQACHFFNTTAALLNTSPAVQQLVGFKCADCTWRCGGNFRENIVLVVMCDVLLGKSVLKVALILFNFIAVILGFPQSLSITIENRCFVHLHWSLCHVSNRVLFKLNYCRKLCLFITILCRILSIVRGILNRKDVFGKQLCFHYQEN